MSRIGWYILFLHPVICLGFLRKSPRIFCSFLTKRKAVSNFISKIIENDIRDNVDQGKSGLNIRTRFPPEPNGYLHLGHAKSILVNYNLAQQFNGKMNMRFDDTNPEKPYSQFVDPILEDVRWLLEAKGSDPWDGPVRFASDYFGTMFVAAKHLIEKGLAYVDSSTGEEIRQRRGTLTSPGVDSPFRSRTVTENLDLFEKMKAGQFSDGDCVLRAKIDNKSPNMNLRDPVLYRIRNGVRHFRTGDSWCIYPMYDFAHPLSDVIEGISYSLCTMEFELNRALYDWVLASIRGCDAIPQEVMPRQVEFTRLNIRGEILSKRKLVELLKVKEIGDEQRNNGTEEDRVQDWSDPRLLTLSGLRSRGVPPASLRLFFDRLTVSKADSVIGREILDECIRETLDASAPRLFAVRRPLAVTLTNCPCNYTEILHLPTHPKNESFPKRKVPFSRKLYISSDDFFDSSSAVPPNGFKRLLPGGLVQLKGAYIIRCDNVTRGEKGHVEGLLCSIQDAKYSTSLSEYENASTTKKIKLAAVQWIDASNAATAEFHFFGPLFANSLSESIEQLSPSSHRVEGDVIVEASCQQMLHDSSVQFERIGYFVPHLVPRLDGKPVFYETVSMKSDWSKGT